MRVLFGRGAPWVLGCCLGACVMTSPKPDSEPAPSVASSAPAVADEGGISPRAAPIMPKTPIMTTPPPKPLHSATVTLPAAKNIKLPTEEKPVVAPLQDKPAPPEPTPVPTPPPRPARGKANTPIPEKLLHDYPWLESCQTRMAFGGAVQCDVDTLLAHPSARVQVYVREPKLIRTYPDGLRIQLREGLPRLYRFYVVP